MTRDTIVRIYSMTKIATTVAALILLEEGRLRLERPGRDVPARTRGAKVFAGGTASAPNSSHGAADHHPRTCSPIRPVMRTGCVLHGGRSVPRAPPVRPAPSDEFVAKVATLPLIAQPGERFFYGVNTDLLG